MTLLNLTWKHHIENVSKIICQRTSLLQRHKSTFSFWQRRNFVNALVLSVLDYCLPIWGFNVCDSVIEKFDRKILYLCNTVIFTKSKHSNYRNRFFAFEKLNWLDFKERRDVYTCEYLYKHVIQQSHLYNILKSDYVKSSREDGMELRAQMNFCVPTTRNKFGQSSFQSQSIKLWNSVPNDIRKEKKFWKFSLQLRKYLLGKRNDEFVTR